MLAFILRTIPAFFVLTLNCSVLSANDHEGKINDNIVELSTCTEGINQISEKLTPYLVYRDGYFHWLDTYLTTFIRGWAQTITSSSKSKEGWVHWGKDFIPEGLRPFSLETRFKTAEEEQLELASLNYSIEDLLYEDTSCTLAEQQTLKKYHKIAVEMQTLLDNADKNFVRDNIIVGLTTYTSYLIFRRIPREKFNARRAAVLAPRARDIPVIIHDQIRDVERRPEVPGPIDVREVERRAEVPGLIDVDGLRVGNLDNAFENVDDPGRD